MGSGIKLMDKDLSLKSELYNIPMKENFRFQNLITLISLNHTRSNNELLQRVLEIKNIFTGR